MKSETFCLQGPDGQLYPQTCGGNRRYTWGRAFLLIPMAEKHGGDLDTAADLSGWTHQQTVKYARWLGWRLVRVSVKPSPSTDSSEKT